MERLSSSLMKLLSSEKSVKDGDSNSEITNTDFITKICKVLVLGAGGLGCEMLKNLVMMGFRNIDIIDVDTVELTNLNRQLLFEEKDIGKAKSIVAAEYFNNFKFNCDINGFHSKIEDFEIDFYKKYHVILCGLDSLEARRWINTCVHDMLIYNEDGTLDNTSIVPIIDGGSEGLKGHVRVIIPGITSCIECNLDLFPPPTTYPLCTLAGTPRRMEHCIEIAKTKIWASSMPLGDIEFDSDNYDHVTWLLSTSKDIAKSNNIKDDLTYDTLMQTLQHIIPSVISANSVIAGICVSECFKLITSISSASNGYGFTMVNLSDSFYSQSFIPEKNMNCVVCSPLIIPFKATPSLKLKEVIDKIASFLSLSNERLTISSTGNECGYSLIYSSINESLHTATKDNYNKSIQDLHLCNSVLNITFSNFPKLIKIKINVEV